MKEKKMNITDLEDLLCDGTKIADMLESEFESLRIDTLGKSYLRGEDVQLNIDFKNYFDNEVEKERRRVRKEEGY